MKLNAFIRFVSGLVSYLDHKIHIVCKNLITIWYYDLTSFSIFMLFTLVLPTGFV